MVDLLLRGGTLIIRRRMRPFVTASKWSHTALMCQESMNGADSTYFHACLTNSCRLSSAFCRSMSLSIFWGPPARRIRSSMRRACSRWALASGDMGPGRDGTFGDKAVVRGASGGGRGSGGWDPLGLVGFRGGEGAAICRRGSVEFWKFLGVSGTDVHWVSGTWDPAFKGG